jgi:phosphoglycerate dehydrogenase-like enzyme
MKLARRIAVGAALAVAAPALAQPTASPQDGRELSRLIAEEGLRESGRTIRELIPNWRPRKVVALVDRPERAQQLQAAAPGVKIVAVRTTEEAVREVKDADGLINSCDPRVITAGQKLRWLQLTSAGVDYCLPQVRSRPGFALTTIQRVQSATLSDHAMGLLLALTRGIDIYSRQMLDGAFDRSKIPPERMWQLRGRTMLVVGLGGIGTDVAAKAHAFGMRVIATRNSGREGPPFVEYVGLANELPELIGRADVVVMTAPLTKETTDLFDRAMFARMRKGALFINVARGGSVVQEDLIEALKSGQVGAAGLDVTDPEPLPKNDPLYTTPNVLITPHVGSAASGSPGTQEETWRVVAENLRRYAAGEKVYNLVDVNRGY